MNPTKKSKERDYLNRMDVAMKLQELQEEFNQRMKEVVKPAPKWMPKRLYWWMATRFLNL